MTAGGNWLDPRGPVMVNGVTVWGFSNPYPSGNQCIGLQSSSFIQQSMYFTWGQHTISLYYHTRSMDNANPINILMNTTIIGTVGSVAVNSWTLCHWEISSQCNYSSVYLFNYKCAN